MLGMCLAGQPAGRKPWVDHKPWLLLQELLPTPNNTHELQEDGGSRQESELLWHTEPAQASASICVYAEVNSLYHPNVNPRFHWWSRYVNDEQNYKAVWLSQEKKKQIPDPGCTLSCIWSVKHIQEYNSVKNVYPNPKVRWALWPLLGCSSKAQDLLQKTSQPFSCHVWTDSTSQ